MRKQSKTRDLFTTSHWQVDLQPLPGKQSSIMPNHYLGRQKWSGWTLSPSSFPQLLLLNMTPYGAVWKTKKALMQCKHCWSIAKTLFSYQHCFGHKSTAPYVMHWRKLTPSQPKPVHTERIFMLSVVLFIDDRSYFYYHHPAQIIKVVHCILKLYSCGFLY